VSRIEIAPDLADDFDRIFDHLAQHDLEHAAARVGAIIQALNIWETNPLIGRPAGNKRELVIGHGSHGYLALCRYVPELCRGNGNFS